jgi:hypothetical protein
LSVLPGYDISAYIALINDADLLKDLNKL